MRADLFLVNNGFCRSRTQAKRMIENGWVVFDGVPVKKASFELEDADKISVLEKEPYVSRGGLKLEEALKKFDVDPSGKICTDIGASTGGFTDCLLQNGAEFVYAVDCGHNQLSGRLLNSPRVLCIEGVNARYLSKKEIKMPCDICVCDLSFISQSLCYEAISSVLKEQADYISLFKPQFEVGPDHVGKNGIVTDRQATLNAALFLVKEASRHSLFFRGFIQSPILGGDGNREFLFHFKKNDAEDILNIKDILEKEIFKI